MVVNFTFEATNGCLNFRSNTENWTQCFLVIDGYESFLGSENREVILNNFLIWINTSSKSEYDGEIQGEKVKWIASLSEKHHCFYGNLDDEEIHFFISDSDHFPPIVVGILELKRIHIQKWKDQIEQLLR